MKRILILITLMIFGGEAAAQCNYPSGSTTKRQGLSMTNVKIPTDTSIPVGSILHVHKFGVDRIKNFTCTKAPNDKYVISVDAPVVTGVTGIRVNRYMKQVLMVLVSKSPIFYAVKMALWSRLKVVQRMCRFPVHQKDITLL